MRHKSGPATLSIIIMKTIQLRFKTWRQQLINDSNKTNSNSRSIRKLTACVFSDYVREDYTELLKRRNPDGNVRIFILAFGAPNKGDTSNLQKIACSNKGYFSKVYNYGDVVPAISNILDVFG